MDKLWTIAMKEIRTRFSDRNLFIITLAAPLVISTIIGLAFGGLGRSTSPIRDIPVAVVNHDLPGSNGTSFGNLLASLLTQGQLPAGATPSIASCTQTSSPSGSSTNSSGITLGELIRGTTFDQNAAQRLVDDKTIVAPAADSGSPEYLDAVARAAVDKGVYAAVVIIPSDFSAALSSLTDPRQAPATTAISVYGNEGQSLAAGIVRSVIEGISSQMVSGNIAIGATFAELAKSQPGALAGASNLDLNQLFLCAFIPGNDLVGLTDKPVQATSMSLAGTLLVTFGSAQALFFALFTGQFGILSMYEERRNWTLQRMIVSPTPRWAILGGKLVGVLVNVLFQLLALVFALTIVGSLIEGHPVFIWGTDLPQLGLVILGVAIAVSGFGMFLAGVLKGIEQANIVGPVLNIALGVLGGAFGFQLPRSVSVVSFVYWGRDAFDTLAAGRGDVSLNILVLFVEGVVLFSLGLFLFNRKFEV
jgi:ABC-type transport system involved in multi-copper enzyme maturation permease subunit